jgi:hypothetical protein
MQSGKEERKEGYVKQGLGCRVLGDESPGGTWASCEDPLPDFNF